MEETMKETVATVVASQGGGTEGRSGGRRVAAGAVVVLVLAAMYNFYSWEENPEGGGFRPVVAPPSSERRQSTMNTQSPASTMSSAPNSPLAVSRRAQVQQPREGEPSRQVDPQEEVGGGFRCDPQGCKNVTRSSIFIDFLEVFPGENITDICLTTEDGDENCEHPESFINNIESYNKDSYKLYISDTNGSERIRGKVVFGP
jgi:hypothetical protein